MQQGLVIFAKDVQRLAAFYRQTLQLDVFESSDSHQVLRGHGYELVIHGIPAKIAAKIQIANPPEPREQTPIKPSFVVASLAEARAAAQATGGYLKPDAKAWHFRGHTVLDGWDPEGNIVQLKQAE
jgi:predicted enzyme related to lactoylglutathione lyase